MTLAKIAAVFCAAVLVATTSLFAGGFQLNEHGARAMAQGGAFAARASDASAIYFNPAGLGFQDVPSVYLGVTLITPNVTFYGPTQVNPAQRTSLVPATFTPINVYGALPITDRIHVGFGVYNPYGLGTEWPANWPGKFLTTKINLETFFFSPTVAYRVNDQLSVGAGFNYVTGSVTLKKAIAVTSIALPDPPRVSIDMTANGVGFNVGAMYKITPELSVGASYRSQVKVDASGTAVFDPNYAALSLPQGDVTTKLTLPATGYLGVAYKLLSNLELEADYQYIGWSSYKELDFEFKANGSHSVSPKNYVDTYILRVGGEYTVAQFHLRAGYYYDHSPVKTEYVEPLLPDANRNGFNVGLGYDLTKNLSLDVSYLFIRFDQRTAVNTIPENSFDGTYNSYADLFGFNLGYTF